MIKNKDPPRENPSGCGGYSSSTVGVHDLASSWHAYQVCGGSRAKRGELRGAACASQGRASGDGGGCRRSMAAEVFQGLDRFG
jgi:hypothetical protein